MKYINSKYGLFDTDNFMYLSDTAHGGGFTSGEGKLTLPATTTKLYISFELWTDGAQQVSCWPLQVYFSDGSYNTVKASTAQIHADTGNGNLLLKTNDTERLAIPFTAQIWHKVYLAVDSVAGTIDFYLDGDKVGTYTEYVKTGVKAISAKIKLQKYGTLHTKARNFIISDQYFPLNEEVITVPATIAADGWSVSGGTYSTDTEGATLTVAPDTSILNGYKVTACNIGIGTATLGDTIKNLELKAGDYTTTREIPATNGGMWIDGFADVKTTTITAKK